MMCKTAAKVMKTLQRFSHYNYDLPYLLCLNSQSLTGASL